MGPLQKEKLEKADWKCHFHHEYETSRCHHEEIHLGQDESIYKAYIMSSRCWTVAGVCSLRKKYDGPGEHSSCMQDDVLGFGFSLTQ